MSTYKGYSNWKWPLTSDPMERVLELKLCFILNSETLFKGCLETQAISLNVSHTLI